PVRELFGRPHLHHAGDAFERMKMAEQLVEHRTADRAAADRRLEREQQASNAHEMLVALGEVVVEKIREADLVERSPLLRHGCPVQTSGRTAAGMRSRAADRSTCGTNGFVRYCVAPAFIAVSRLSSSPRVVSTITGTSRQV